MAGNRVEHQPDILEQVETLGDELRAKVEARARAIMQTDIQPWRDFQAHQSAVVNAVAEYVESASSRNKPTIKAGRELRCDLLKMGASDKEISQFMKAADQAIAKGSDGRSF